MEIFDSLTNILSILFGGSLISIVTWRFARKKAAAEAQKAEAEAKQAEAEAKKAEAEAMKEKQDYYQQMAEDLAKDRDYYKQQRDEFREKIDKLTKMFYELKTDGEKERAQLRAEITAVKTQMSLLSNKTCSVEDCKMRQVINFIKTENKNRQQKKEIEPLNIKDM